LIAKSSQVKTQSSDLLDIIHRLLKLGVEKSDGKLFTMVQNFQ
jgi:hypothetical protein